MKKTLFILIIFAGLSSCEDDKKESINPDSPEAWLLDPATGWQHVMSIESNGTLSAYDMTMAGQEIAVLYGSLIYDGGPQSRFYKVKFKENDLAASEGMRLDFSTDDKTIYNSQFIPETFIPVFTNFEGTGAVGIVDENNTRVTRLETDRVQASEFINYHYSKAGDFLGAAVLGSHIPFSTQYWSGKFPTPVIAGFMPLIDTDKDRVSFKSKIVIPLKLSDDQPYTFTIGEEGTKLKYQVLKLLPGKQRIDPNYEIVDQAEFTGLEASSLDALEPYRTLVTYRFDDDVLTFVLADFKMVSGVYTMNKLHCYRWNKRTNGISTLWESSEVDVTLGKAIEKDRKDGIPTTLPYLENRLTPDGTFYTIYTKQLYTEPLPEQEYVILYTVNATGITELNHTDYIYKNYKKTVRISNCRYMNGAYYALVYPVGTEYIKTTDPKYHIEVVKLKQ
ncbi:MAG: hypothetical protein WDO14_06355 [Bacteroidota bacterium]